MMDLIRRDAAATVSARWVVLVIIGTQALLAQILALWAFSTEGGRTGLGDTPPIWGAVVMWLSVVVVLLLVARGRRYHEFDMALPIPAARLWSAHTGLLAAVTSVTVAATSLLNWVLVLTAGAKSWEADVLWRMLALLAPVGFRAIPAAVLSAVVVQSLKAGHDRPPALREPLMFGTLAALLPVFLLVEAFPAVGIVVVALAAGLWAWTLRRLPSAFEMVGPVTRVGGGAPATAREAVVPAMSPARLVAVVHRSLNKMPLGMLVLVPVLLAFGFLLSGFVRRAGEDPIRFGMVAMTAYILLAASGMAPRRLFLIDGLPISRRAVFAIIVLPLIGLVTFGYATGEVLGDVVGSGHPLITVIETDGTPGIRVVVEAFRAARPDEVPPNTSPWGESHRPAMVSPWPDARYVLYSPYSVPPDASQRFFELQLARAYEDLYGTGAHGVEVSFSSEASAEVQRTMPVPPPHGSRWLAPDLRAPAYPVLLAVALIPWFLFFALYARTMRAGISEKVRGTAFWAALGLLLFVHLAQFRPLIDDRVDLLAAGGLIHAALRGWAAWMPGGFVGVWVACALAVVPAYLLAQEFFVRVESSPGDDRKFSFLDRG
jgi:hypothetical protein